MANTTRRECIECIHDTTGQFQNDGIVLLSYTSQTYHEENVKYHGRIQKALSVIFYYRHFFHLKLVSETNNYVFAIYIDEKCHSLDSETEQSSCILVTIVACMHSEQRHTYFLWSAAHFWPMLSMHARHIRTHRGMWYSIPMRSILRAHVYARHSLKRHPRHRSRI